MPTKSVEDLVLRLVRLEERVKLLMTWQKWQMVVLAGILIAVVSKHF